MSFFELSDGSAIAPSNEFTNTGIQPLIPAGTQLLCAVASAAWTPATDDNEESVEIELHVVQPGDYKDFLVKHRLRVNDGDPKRRDKALKMLMAYDSNAKGGLLATDKAGKQITDQVLARALNGAEVLATFDVWEMEGRDGETRSGNWVRGIAPKPAKFREEDARIQAKAKDQPDAPDDYDDDIPFN